MVGSVHLEKEKLNMHMDLLLWQHSLFYTMVATSRCIGEFSCARGRCKHQTPLNPFDSIVLFASAESKHTSMESK